VCPCACGSLQQGQTISGRIEGGKAGEPLVVLAVGGVARAHVAVEADGSFKLSGLPPGTYDLLVYTPQSDGGTRARREGVRAGSSDVRIELAQK
jgi:hypothetical protein